MSVYNFKVGDWVERVADDFADCKKGRIYQITKICFNGYSLEVAGSRTAYNIEGFKLAKDPNIRFDHSKLKTGYRVTLENGEMFTCYVDCCYRENGHEICGTVLVKFGLGIKAKWGGLDFFLQNYGDIIKVESSSSPFSEVYDTVWERKVPTPQELLKKELLAKLEEHKLSMKALEDQINAIE